MIIDDSETILQIAEFILKKMGHEVITSVDGETGWMIFKDTRPDLLFLDLNLPGINGDTLCKKIKMDSDLSQTPVVLLTASDEDLMRQVMTDTRADDWLRKPFDPSALRAKADEFLK
ncbi:MAG: response regulator [Candidatus Omnitrophica bacterium]|nr:response regulator [Candidatus Omnitrophota bacterium]